MPDGDSTRDIAVAADTKINHHMTDCVAFREALRNDLKDFRDDLKKLNWRMAMLLGALVIVSHGVDWLLSVTGHR